MNPLFKDYADHISSLISQFDWAPVEELAQEISTRFKNNNHVFLCGNGGSAANTTHLANDFIYGVNPEGPAVRVTSLTDNPSILTCLGNDTGFENIFSHQLKTLAEKEDILIVFSGSGNSPNILKALETARSKGMKTAAIVGFGGGQCKAVVDICIHFEIQDMQISEDMQQIVGHMLTRYLNSEQNS